MKNFTAISTGRLLSDVLQPRGAYFKGAARSTKRPRFADEYPDIAFLMMSLAHPELPDTKDARSFLQGLKPGSVFMPTQVMVDGSVRSKLRKYEEAIPIHLPVGLDKVFFTGRRSGSLENLERDREQGFDPNDPDVITNQAVLMKPYMIVDPHMRREFFGEDIRLPYGSLLMRVNEDTDITVMPNQVGGQDMSPDSQEMALDLKRHGFMLAHLVIEDSYYWGRWRLCQVWQMDPSKFVHQFQRADGGITIMPDKQGMSEIFHDIPRLRWESKAHWKPITMLRYALDCIDPLWQSNKIAKWRAVAFLFDFLLYAFGHHSVQHLPLSLKDPGVHSRILEVLNTWRAFHLYPFPYFGQLLYELSDDTAQFPEPLDMKKAAKFMHELIPPRRWRKPWIEAEPWSAEDPRLDTFVDVEAGYGEMLMAASNYTYELHATATDVNPLVAKALLLHSYLYMPWFVQGTNRTDTNGISNLRYTIAAERLTALLKFKHLPEDYFDQTELEAESPFAPLVQRRWKVPEVAPVNRYRINRIVEDAIADDEPKRMTIVKDDRYRLRQTEETTEPPLLAARKVRLRSRHTLPEVAFDISKTIPETKAKGFTPKLKPHTTRLNAERKRLKPEDDQ